MTAVTAKAPKGPVKVNADLPIALITDCMLAPGVLSVSL